MNKVDNDIPIEKNFQENFSQKKNEEKKDEPNIPSQIKKQLKSTNQLKTSPIKNINNPKVKINNKISSFQDLIDIANAEKEIELKYDLERNVKLVSFNKGKIDICFNEKLNKNFIKNLTEKLFLWTNERWIISLSKNTVAKSIYERNMDDKKKQLVEFKKSKIAKDIESAFPDAILTDIIDGEQ